VSRLEGLGLTLYVVRFTFMLQGLPSFPINPPDGKTRKVLFETSTVTYFCFETFHSRLLSRWADTGAAQAPRAAGVPLSGCGLSFSVKDPERQSRSKGNCSLRFTVYVLRFRLQAPICPPVAKTRKVGYRGASLIRNSPPPRASIGP